MQNSAARCNSVLQAVPRLMPAGKSLLAAFFWVVGAPLNDLGSEALARRHELVPLSKMWTTAWAQSGVRT